MLRATASWELPCSSVQQDYKQTFLLTVQTNQATAGRHLKSDGYRMSQNLLLNTGYRDNTSATVSHNVGKDPTSWELSGAPDIVVLWLLKVSSMMVQLSSKNHIMTIGGRADSDTILSEYFSSEL